MDSQQSDFDKARQKAESGSVVSQGYVDGATCMAEKQVLTTQKPCDGSRQRHMRAVLRVHSFISGTCMWEV